MFYGPLVKSHLANYFRVFSFLEFLIEVGGFPGLFSVWRTPRTSIELEFLWTSVDFHPGIF